MNSRTILTCAVTGGDDVAHKFKQLPVTPDQIAQAVVDSAGAGAAIAHIHVRHPETGKPSMELDYYRQVVDLVRESSADVILNLTTGPGARFVPALEQTNTFAEGSNVRPPAERVRHILELRPEICTLDMGSVNFGRGALINTPAQIEAIAAAIQEAGSLPELEVFEAGHLALALNMLKSGANSSHFDLPVRPGNSVGCARNHRDGFLFQVRASGGRDMGRVRGRPQRVSDGRTVLPYGRARSGRPRGQFLPRKGRRGAVERPTRGEGRWHHSVPGRRDRQPGRGPRESSGWRGCIPSFKAACLQLTPGNDLSRNLAEISALAAAAAAGGARLVALPEFTTYLDRSSKSMRSSATAEAESAALLEMQALARRLDVWLLVGSLVMLAEGDPDQRLANRSFLIASTGEVVARYDKIHMFDARLGDGRAVGESRHYAGGSQAVVVQTPLGTIGMSVCYDLRFPQLYRELASGGAQILVIPSAFTAETGRAHWEPLLRARAIETGCYVLAPATCGTHPGDWQTYGHASIIDPWGQVLDSCGEEPGTFCMAEIDVARCDEVRSRIPSLRTNPVFRLVQEQSDHPSKGGNDV